MSEAKSWWEISDMNKLQSRSAPHQIFTSLLKTMGKNVSFFSFSCAVKTVVFPAVCEKHFHAIQKGFLLKLISH